MGIGIPALGRNRSLSDLWARTNTSLPLSCLTPSSNVGDDNEAYWLALHVCRAMGDVSNLTRRMTCMLGRICREAFGQVLSEREYSFEVGVSGKCCERE